ncbi:uncharacterized protein LOC127881946 [Dreissena polymorpha]|uniref:Mab-21-like HhH/H2TH-like domain-containing protein n=1 Tax=Dreissena polymorpha TaxID=45954 RepID=A0A9D4GIK4_DREPO|nr:uncharacterized protein LOC127881946 [Dreissena polymorpha]KAH3816104.1 hypothetical protein DPMN_117612 [Dreissena polymorpha]
MHLRVKDSHLKERWSNFIDQDGFVHGYNIVKSVRGLSSILMDIYMAQTSGKPFVIETKSGKLKLAGVKVFREPNTELILLWTTHDRGESFQISVDVSPAIRCHNIEDAVTIEDCLDENIFREVCDHGSFLLTSGRRDASHASPSKCFRISLTEVEVKIMLKLTPKHKICYRVLKFFFTEICKTLSVRGFIYFGLSSYCLKTAVLHHLRSCSNTNQETIHSCMESVVLFLLDALSNDMHQRPVLPSIFIKDHNLFESLSRFQTDKRIALNLVMHAKCLLVFRSLVKNFGTIPSSDYCYNSCLKTFNDTLSHMETSKSVVMDKANQFVNSQGHWKAMVTVKDLLTHFDGT